MLARSRYEAAFVSVKRIARLLEVLQSTTLAVVRSEEGGAATLAIESFARSALLALSVAATAWESWDRKGKQIAGVDPDTFARGQRSTSVVNCDAFGSASLISAPLLSLRHAPLMKLMDESDALIVAAFGLDAPRDLAFVLGSMAAFFVCHELANEFDSLGTILRDLRGREANSMRQLSKPTID